MNLRMQAQITEGDGAQHPEHPLKKTQVTFHSKGKQTKIQTSGCNTV